MKTSTKRVRTSIGRELAALRYKLGVGVSEMSKDLNITRQFLHGIEIGIKQPPKSLVESLSTVYSLEKVQVQMLEGARIRSLDVVPVNMVGLSESKRELTCAVVDRVQDERFEDEDAEALRNLFAGEAIIVVEMFEGKVVGVKTTIPVAMTAFVVDYTDKGFKAKKGHCNVEIINASRNAAVCDAVAQIAEQG